MKFNSLALAATLALAGTAFAASSNAPASVKRDVTKVVEVAPHAKDRAEKHHAHHAKKHAKEHHAAMHGVRHQRMEDRTVSAPADTNSASRPARMDEALQRFRASRG